MTHLKNRTLRLENLEDRRTMAGNLTLEYSTTRITIKGDSAASDVKILTDVHGKGTIENIGGKINGRTGVVSFKPQGRELWVDLGGGADKLKIAGVSSRRMEVSALTVLSDSLDRPTGPDGADSVAIDYVNATSSVGKMSLIYTGHGNAKDTVTVNNSYFKNELGISTGGGNDVVKMKNVKVGKTLEVQLHGGDDEVSRVDVVFAKGWFDGGAGSDKSTRSGGSAAKHFVSFER